jgi:hypothetical protein
MDDAEIREIAATKAMELGFDSGAANSEIYHELRPDDQLFLDDEGIDDRDGVVAVHFGSPSAFDLGGFQLVTRGGDLTVYVHVPSGAVRAAWVEE